MEDWKFLEEQGDVYMIQVVVGFVESFCGPLDFGITRVKVVEKHESKGTCRLS